MDGRGKREKGREKEILTSEKTPYSSQGTSPFFIAFHTRS
jgi:hypothetical protein